MSAALEVAEERWANEQTHPQATMMLVVVEQVLAVSVVEVEHQELVVLLADAEAHVNNGVEVEIPTLTLDKGHIGHPSPAL